MGDSVYYIHFRNLLLCTIVAQYQDQYLVCSQHGNTRTFYHAEARELIAVNDIARINKARELVKRNEQLRREMKELDKGFEGL